MRPREGKLPTYGLHLLFEATIIISSLSRRMTPTEKMCACKRLLYVFAGTHSQGLDQNEEKRLQVRIERIVYFSLMFIDRVWGPEHDPVIKNCSGVLGMTPIKKLLRGPGQDPVNKNCPRKKKKRSVRFFLFIEIKCLYSGLFSMAAAAHAGCTTPPVP